MIAALGDIHGNLPALEAALAEIRSTGADEVWCHGDISYGGPWPRECADLIRAEASVVTRGNTDDWIWAHEEISWQTDGAKALLEIAVRDAGLLGPDLCEWFRSLPTDYEVSEGIPLVLTHATRPSHWARIPSLDDPDEVWLEAYGPAPASVVCGHNHRAFQKRIGTDLVVFNTGSIGAPADGDWRPSFALIRREGGQWAFSHRRVEYDRDMAAASFEKLGHREGDRFAHQVRTGSPK